MDYDRISMISQATIAVSTLDKKDVTIVKSLGKPPEPVKEVLKATFLLLGHAESDLEWNRIQAHLAKPDLFERVKAVDVEKIPHDTRKKAAAILSKYSTEKVRNVSSTLETFYNWALAVTGDY